MGLVANVLDCMNLKELKYHFPLKEERPSTMALKPIGRPVPIFHQVFISSQQTNQSVQFCEFFIKLSQFHLKHYCSF